MIRPRDDSDCAAVDIEHVSAKCSVKPSTVDSELDNNVGLLVNKFGCKYIQLYIPSDMKPPYPNRSKHTISDTLMSAARARDSLPRAKSGKDKLYNDLTLSLVSPRQLLKSMVMRWSMF